MKNIGKRLAWVSAYAVAMALLEAVVVVYIRGLLQVTNDQVALGPYVRMEMGREAATVVMLGAVGWLAGRHRLERWAYGLFAFGLWDVCYYAWLKLLIDWPTSRLDWDVLFLMPLRWWGPVLSPMLIAVLLCITAALSIIRTAQGERLAFTSPRIAMTTLGALLALYVFMCDSLHALLAGRPDWDTLRPEPFQWHLFLLALALMALPSLLATWPQSGTMVHTPVRHPSITREEASR
jgi:hypothetical protein